MDSNCCLHQTNASVYGLYVESVLGPAYPTYRVLLTTVILYSLILAFGVLGNVCAILSILRYSRKGCASNLYLLSLAISDLTLLIFGLPLELRDAVTAYYPYSLPEFVCPSRAFLIEMSGNVSALTITAFSIQRWLAICFPLKARSAYRFRRTLKILFGVWIVGGASACPVIVAVKINRLAAPDINENGDFVDSTAEDPVSIPGTEFCAADANRPMMELVIIQYSFLAFFIIPLIVIVVLYIHIAITIRRTCSIQSPLLRQHRDLGQRKSAVRMLVAVAAAFFICWCPFHMQRLLSVYKFGEMVPWIEDIYSLLYFISGYFYYANAVVNPLVYTIMSQRIRKGLMTSLRQKSMKDGSTLFLHGVIENEYSPAMDNNSPYYATSSFYAIPRSILSAVLVATRAGRNPRTMAIRQEATSSSRSSRLSSYPTIKKNLIKRLDNTKTRISSSPQLV